MALAQIRNGETGAGLKTLLKERLDVVVMAHAAEKVRRECHRYANTKHCYLKRKSVQELREFSYDAMGQEFATAMPFTTKMISSACLRPQEGKVKTHASLAPAVSSVIAKALGIYSESLTGYRHYVSTLLVTGGAKESCISRLSRIYDCMHYSTTLHMQDAFAAVIDEDLKGWKDDASTFNIVYDNVDKHVRSRHTKNKNKMVHMVQGIAVKNRINFDEVADAAPCVPMDVPPSKIIPSPDDEGKLVAHMARLVRTVWSRRVAALEWMKPADHTHSRMTETSSKSEVVRICVHMFCSLYCLIVPEVGFFTSCGTQHDPRPRNESQVVVIVLQINLGVMQKNENDPQDMVEIIEHYHQYVPTAEDGTLEPVLLVGKCVSVPWWSQSINAILMLCHHSHKHGASSLSLVLWCRAMGHTT